MRIPDSLRCLTRATALQLVASVCVLTIVCNCAGCSWVQAIQDNIYYNDPVDDFVIGWRNKAWSDEAWRRAKHEFEGHPQFHAFGEGFKAGYVNIASGGNGCPPPVPPNKYWNWRYQSLEGQAKVAAWFEGWPYGVAAAEQDNAGAGREIQVSEPIRIEHSPYFLNQPVPEEFLPPDQHQEAEPGTGTEREILPLTPPSTGSYQPSPASGRRNTAGSSQGFKERAVAQLGNPEVGQDSQVKLSSYLDISDSRLIPVNRLKPSGTESAPRGPQIQRLPPVNPMDVRNHLTPSAEQSAESFDLR